MQDRDDDGDDDNDNDDDGDATNRIITLPEAYVHCSRHVCNTRRPSVGGRSFKAVQRSSAVVGKLDTISLEQPYYIENTRRDNCQVQSMQ